MPVPVPETMNQRQQRDARRHHGLDDYLILSELNPTAVIDHLDGGGAPLNLMTFGNVREVCPKCKHNQLKLVLRQATVRIAHLFCADCASCFDAHYPNGRSALTI
ncbi:MAG: hypothetical protein ACJ8LG_04865 [Massilia sp.]